MKDILTFGVRNTIGEELINLFKKSNSNFRIISYSKVSIKKIELIF